jgi:folate-binding Fe-S cluster repair protein YgfZ
VFIYPHNNGVAFPHPVFLIDCPASEQDTLLAHLCKYRLRAKVDIRPTNDYAVWSVWGPASQQLWWRHHSNNTEEAARLPVGQLIKRDGIGFADMGMADRRASDMGFRVVTHEQHPCKRSSSERTTTTT